MLPGLSQFIEKMKEMRSDGDRTKTTLQSPLKSRTFTSSRHYIFPCEESEAPFTRYWAQGNEVIHMNGGFDLEKDSAERRKKDTGGKYTEGKRESCPSRS